MPTYATRMTSPDPDAPIATRLWRRGGAILLGLSLIALLVFSQKLVEVVPADQYVVVQSVAGNLVWYTDPGPAPQLFGYPTAYKRRGIYHIDKPFRFNDGANAKMVGSVQYELPANAELLTKLHRAYGSQEAIETQLIKTVVDNAVYMTGPVMNSKESYGAKKPDLLHYVQDQIEHGIYRTRTVPVWVQDPITNEWQQNQGVEFIENNGVKVRQEDASTLEAYGITTMNFTITDIPYDDKVEAQIRAQQEAQMNVQTAIARAKEADQAAITAEADGRKNAAVSKWSQEVIKAQAVTQAQQEKEVATLGAQKKLDVARLDAAAADQYKIAMIARGDGDAAYKKKVMEADGALQQKLDAQVMINRVWAENIGKSPLTPAVYFGGGGTGTAPTSMDLVSMLTAKTATDIAALFPSNGR